MHKCDSEVNSDAGDKSSVEVSDWLTESLPKALEIYVLLLHVISPKMQLFQLVQNHWIPYNAFQRRYLVLKSSTYFAFC